MRGSLSVIIPNYNKEKYIKRCVDSIISQTFLPEEIIIVDDASTDASKEVIESLSKEYSIIKPVFPQINGGVSNARNVGLSKSNSEYVTYIDSDDYYYCDYKLEKEMFLVKEYRDKGIDIVAYSSMVIVNEQEEPVYIPVLKKAWYLNGWVFNKFVSRIKVETIPRDYIVKKEIINSVGAYNYPKDLYEDLDLLFRLSRVVPFYNTLCYGTAYVKTEGGLSAAKKEEHDATINSIVREYKKYFSFSDRILSIVYKVSWKIERIILRVLRKIYTGI